MRHQKAHRKLGRTTEHRVSMLRNLATSLINAREERIVTTLPKAKELRPFVERAITLSCRAQHLEGDSAKINAVHLRRQAAGFFHAGNMQQSEMNGKRGQAKLPRTAGVAAVKRLFDELGERYKDRPGGYTRIFKLGKREGDNAELAIIELVDNPREVLALENAKKRAKHGAPKKKKSSEAKETAAPRAAKVSEPEVEPAATVEAAPAESSEAAPEVEAETGQSEEEAK
ncbi:MAG TPA: 50S ribosomal protein L17 [Pyrinomonadaceae bacterium]|nr:50S ribosomal protein L17 [Pyrinomonadaceae bacterium]